MRAPHVERATAAPVNLFVVPSPEAHVDGLPHSPAGEDTQAVALSPSPRQPFRLFSPSAPFLGESAQKAVLWQRPRAFGPSLRRRSCRTRHCRTSGELLWKCHLGL